MSQKHFYVYMLSSVSGTLYTGMTNDLERRMYEHKQKLTPGFTSTYNATRLVYVETYDSPSDAIAREKQIKGWRREKKLALIEQQNPQWLDLSADWFEVT